MSRRERTAVVVGAGIGGLAAAAGLARSGWQVTVLERTAEVRESGAGISLLANAQRSLDQLGVGAAVRARSVSMLPGGEGVRRSSGRLLMKPADPEFVARHGLTTIVLPRPELHRALRDAIPEKRVRSGTEVTYIEQGDDAMEVHYRSGFGEHHIHADVVVAADGLHSRTRQQLFPNTAAPVYSGHSVWRGIADVYREEIGGTTWGTGREFGRMPLTGGRVYWYGVANTPAGEWRADEHAEALHRFGTWHDPIPELIRATPRESVLHHDVFELLDPLPNYVSGRTALLGDAAHAMTSDLGQGACQAIEDAVVLCVALADHGSVVAALENYDEQRRPRTQMITEASRRIGRVKLRERKWEVLLRNAMMAVTPAAAGERAMARIGDWQPPKLRPEAVSA